MREDRGQRTEARDQKAKGSENRTIDHGRGAGGHGGLIEWLRGMIDRSAPYRLQRLQDLPTKPHQIVQALSRRLEDDMIVHLAVLVDQDAPEPAHPAQQASQIRRNQSRRVHPADEIILLRRQAQPQGWGTLLTKWTYSEPSSRGASNTSLPEVPKPTAPEAGR